MVGLLSCVEVIDAKAGLIFCSLSLAASARPVDRGTECRDCAQITKSLSALATCALTTRSRVHTPVTRRPSEDEPTDLLRGAAKELLDRSIESNPQKPTTNAMTAGPPRLDTPVTTAF